LACFRLILISTSNFHFSLPGNLTTNMRWQEEAVARENSKRLDEERKWREKQEKAAKEAVSFPPAFVAKFPTQLLRRNDCTQDSSLSSLHPRFLGSV
jgi:hypothetical protein